MTTRRAAVYAAAALIVAGAAVPSHSAVTSVAITSMTPLLAKNTDTITMTLEMTGTTPSGTVAGYTVELRRSISPTDIVTGTVTDVTLLEDRTTTKMTVDFNFAPASPLGGTQPKAPGSYDLDIRWAAPVEPVAAIVKGSAAGPTAGPIVDTPIVQGGCTKCFTLLGTGKASVTGVYPDVRPRSATAQQVSVFGSGFTKGARVVISKPGQKTPAPGLVVATKTETSATTFPNAGEHINTTEVRSNVTVCPETSLPTGCNGVTAALGEYDVAVYNAHGLREDFCGRCFTVGSVTATYTATGAKPNTGPVSLKLAVVPLVADTRIRIERAGYPPVYATNVKIETPATPGTPPANLTFDIDLKYLAPDAAGKPKWSFRATLPDGREALCLECLEVGGLPPTLTTVKTSRVETNRGTAVTLTGTNIANGAKLTFAKSGIAATPVQVSSAGVATTTISVEPSVSAGAVDVTLVNTDNRSTVACLGCVSVIRATTLVVTVPDDAPHGETVSLGVKLVDTEKPETSFASYEVRLLSRKATALDWDVVSVQKTNDAGTASWEVPVDGTTSYRAEFDGGDNLASTATTRTVLARGSVSLSAPRNGQTVSTRPTFSGRVLPGAANVDVYELRNGTAVLLGSASARNGAWSVTVSLPAGRHTVFAQLPNDESYAGAKTSSITVTSR